MITTLSTDFADLVAEFISHELALAETGKLVDPGFTPLAFKDNVLVAYRDLNEMFPSAQTYSIDGTHSIVSIARHSYLPNQETINGVTQFKLLIIPVHNWESASVIEYDVSPEAKLINYTVPAEYEVTAGYYRKSQCTVNTESAITGPFVVDAGAAWSITVPEGTTEPAVFISCAIAVA